MSACHTKISRATSCHTDNIQIQKGSGAKSYTVYAEGSLAYKELRKYLVTYDDSEEAVNLYI